MMEEFSLYDIGCACLALLPIIVTGVIIAIAFIVVCPPVYAAEQITNGNFETGDFTGWTLFGPRDLPNVTSSEKHSGTYSAKIPDDYYYSGINQQVDLTGVNNISYWTYHFGSGMTVKVDGSTIYTEAGDATSWIWRNISVSYTGTHWVNWTGNQDNIWWVDDISANATSTPPTPTPTPTPSASFIANVTCGSIPFYVLFTDTSTGPPDEWNWSSNGNYSDEQNPVFYYDTLGKYSVNLNATNSFGSSYFNRTNYIRAVPDWYECPPETTRPVWTPEINPPSKDSLISLILKFLKGVFK